MRLFFGPQRWSVHVKSFFSLQEFRARPRLRRSLGDWTTLATITALLGAAVLTAPPLPAAAA